MASKDTKTKNVKTKESGNVYDLKDLTLTVSGKAVVENVRTRVFEKDDDGNRVCTHDVTQTLTFDFENIDESRLPDVATVLVQELIVKYQNNRARRNPSEWLDRDAVTLDVADLLTKQTSTGINPEAAIKKVGDDKFAELVAAEMRRRGLDPTTVFGSAERGAE